MRYWIFVFLLSLVSFGFSGVLYFLNRSETTNLPNLQREPLRNYELSESTKEVELLFVGDIMLSRSVGAAMQRESDFAYPFRLIADTLASADITFGNLEGPISSRGANQGSIYSFRADPRVIEGLRLAGFDVLSLANNHIMDWGQDALEDTITLLKENNIAPVGAGRNYEEANETKFVEINSPSAREIRVGFLAYTNLYPEGLVAGEERPGVSDARLEYVLERVAEARGQADILVVSYHWGEEYATSSSVAQREVARAIIDAGADLVVGHHPHVVQEVEKYKDGWIAYSLGNFVFDQSFSEETMRGLMLRVFIRDEKVSRVEELPIRTSETFQPYAEIR